ncbi:DUF1553 domain-containing protein [Sediminibacterium sp. WSJ-3]|nr:DUF1553 domain-containing protein [Sediminibacterium soli]
MLYRKNTWVVAALSAGALFSMCMRNDAGIDFNTDIKPLLNKKCITCHGGVKRQGGFSLLFRSDALAVNKSGKPAIVPGDPSHSEMIRRLRLDDAEDRMPYHSEPLSAKEIDLLSKWIKQGAKWGDHWAYVPVAPTALPETDHWFFGIKGGKKWIKNDIDAFTYAKMKEQGLSPSAEAGKPALLRRISLDITGLPPSAELARQFLNDTREDAYEKLVDTLLASRHYGEKWAAMWMDLARYADTKGYERDDWRSIWRYRDWLIRAFNTNKPYDRFLTEQLAGDLLPDATDEDFIATAFNRNTMTNDEGGTDNEEFRTAAVMDRVNTTWEAMMGTTFACVQCHSHPYDPFRHEEYYKFMAFFNNTRDEDTYNDYPLLREYHHADSAKYNVLRSWLRTNAAEREKEITGFVKTQEPAINSLVADQLTNSAIADTKWLVLRNNGIARIADVTLTNRSQIMYRYVSGKPGGKWTIRLDAPDGPLLQTVSVQPSKNGWAIASMPVPATQGKHHLYFSYHNPNLKTAEETGIQFDWFFLTNPFPGKGKPGYDSAYKYFYDLLYAKDVTITPVMMENPDDMIRETHVFERGNWLVKGAGVSADVPRSLGALPAKAPRNRLGLAMWITDRKNPLTARTIVNRIWEQFFGQGIAETLEDLGTQGMQPTHRELLDHLSWQLMRDYQWDLKKLIRQIVLSATYRQDSKLNSESLAKDPFNKLYARGARVRLSAEQLRDQSLVVSGLFNEKMFGPGVFPYQPDGIWLSPWNGATWKQSANGDQYRRALYTYWKRTAPYPSMITFDGTAREVCSARRIRTNTPLQSLTTLNDSAYTEAAQHFAYRMQQSGGKDVRSQIKNGYRQALYQSISDEKLAVFERLYTNAFRRYAASPKDMKLMAGTDPAKQTPQTAALVVVAGAMMNMDEFITKN